SASFCPPASQLEMGCSASVSRGDAVQEVEAWYKSLVPSLQIHAAVLLPAEGCALAAWDKEYLLGKGLPPGDSARLLACRDKAAKKLPAEGGAGAQPAAASATQAASPEAGEAEDPSPPDAAPDANSGAEGAGNTDGEAKPSKKEALVVLARKGLKYARLALGKLGPVLPFPGAEAANLLLKVLDTVDAALVNNDNLKGLCERALAFLDLLEAYAEELTRLRRYKEVVCTYRDHLQSILSYAKAYTTRNCIIRLLTTGGDAEQYEGLVATMDELHKCVGDLVAFDSYMRIQSVQAVVEESKRLLEKAVAYRDPSTDARALVTQLGGLAVVLKDSSMMEAVVQKLSVDARVTMHSVSSLLEAHMDNGLQRHILQPELRLFWFRTYGMETEVPWYVWWQDFPAQLEAGDVDLRTLAALRRLFVHAAARTAFERAVQGGHSEAVNVWKLKRAFVGEERLAPQVRHMLSGVDAVDVELLLLENLEPSTPGLLPSSSTEQAAQATVTSVNADGAEQALPEVGMDAAATAEEGHAAAPPVERPVQAAERGNSLVKELALKGMKVARTALEKLGPSLPFPGEQAANLVLALLDAVDAAVVINDNLKDLCDRALAFLDLLDAYAQELTRLRRYKEVVGAYQDHLQSILSYAKAYATRNCILRLLTTGGDAEQYEGLVATMEELCKRVGDLVAFDSNMRIQSVQAVVEESKRLLEKVAAYKDPAADARALVAKEGGIDAVLADGTKLAAVMQTLNVDTRITIGMVSSLIESHLDKTAPQRHIRQPDLRLFWKKHFGRASEVPWTEFWQMFPKDTPVDKPLVEELGQLLADKAAQEAFERSVERSRPETVSVWELRAAFQGGQGLVDQVAAIKQGWLAEAKDNLGSSTASRAGESRVCCQLPQLPPNYTGRDADATEVSAHLDVGSVVLFAPGGMGKSCLAADVGWRLVRGGRAPSGMLWVDLSGAGNVAEVEARFCATLDLTPEKSGNAMRIVAALRHLEDAAGAGCGSTPRVSMPISTLMVVDNAEDALLQAEAADALRGLLGQILKEETSMRLMLTTRVALGPEPALPEHKVGAIRSDAAVQLLQRAVEDLSEEEAAEVANVCHCVPLVLTLVAEALAAERLTLEELKGQADATANDDATAAAVRLVLASLRKPQQLQAAHLAVFPSAFDDEAAAALLWGKPQSQAAQAQGLLAVLCRYSVVQRTGPQQYRMHTLVRQMAMEQGVKLVPKLQVLAEGRFTALLLQLLGEWGAMYATAKEWQLALVAAQEHTADIGRFCELLASVSEEQVIVIAGGLNEDVIWLLEDISMLGRLQVPCEELRARLESGPKTVEAELAVACLLCLLARVQYRTAPDTAEALAQRSWEIQSHMLGAEHKSTLASLGILAICVDFNGRPEEAQELHRNALEAKRHVLGTEHPNTLASLSNLAGCLQACGCCAEAEALYQEALDASRRALRAEHPDTLATLSNMAACIRTSGRYVEAEQLYKEALVMSRRVLGAEHSDTLLSLSYLGECLKAGGRQEEGNAMLREALGALTRVLGADHPDTCWTARLLLV
ncbi:Kinesin light chain, partial [Tetrabaena socialis]